VTHTRQGQFDREDLLLITNLTRFASAAFTTLQNQRSLEAVQKRLEREQQRAERNHSDFLATLAHELRNPLAPMISAMEYLHMDAEPDAIEAARALMDRQLHHLERLADDLIDGARVPKGSLICRSKPLRSRILPAPRRKSVSHSLRKSDTSSDGHYRRSPYGSMEI
jgi:signal transduction histidine kinase